MLDIDTPMLLSSDVPTTATGTQRLIDICRHCNATEYLCGEGALAYIDKSLFTDVKLTMFKPDVEDNYTGIQHI
jgi:hypothetical protein